MEILEDLQVPADDYVLTRMEVIAPSLVGPHRATDVDGFAWVTVMGEARANSRPLARYLALMMVAGAIAGLGVLTDNAILIVGAMAVSPDLLPICSTCVGLVGRRPALARRAFVTLWTGLALTCQRRLLDHPRRARGWGGRDARLRDAGERRRGRRDLGDDDPRVGLHGGARSAPAS